MDTNVFICEQRRVVESLVLNKSFRYSKELLNCISQWDHNKCASSFVRASWGPERKIKGITNKGNLHFLSSVNLYAKEGNDDDHSYGFFKRKPIRYERWIFSIAFKPMSQQIVIDLSPEFVLKRTTHTQIHFIIQSHIRATAMQLISSNSHFEYIR